MMHNRNGISNGEHIVRPQPDVSFLERRYDEEMSAAAIASSRQEKIVHLELALQFALRARDARGRFG